MNRKSIRFRLLFASGLVAVIAFCMALGFSYLPQYKTEAQTSLPASMSAIQVGNIAVMSGQLGAGTKETPWMDIMSTSIKTSQMKDLMMTASLEVGLYTNTLVNSKNGTSDTSSASAGVEVQVIIDPGPNQRIADPGVVVFGRRTQTLSATLQGLISGCQTVDPTTGAV
ncbi:MAG: hypothetical protein J2P41_17060, partial [Blastocatellia bacterium]|nr:hypothetical protein [Blastocatellia bacterium]